MNENEPSNDVPWSVSLKEAFSPWIIPLSNLIMSLALLFVVLRGINENYDILHWFNEPVEADGHFSELEAHLPAGSLGYVIKAAATTAGWEVVWNTNIHPRGPSMPFNPEISSFESWAISAMRDSNYPLYSTFYEGNKVLVVSLERG